MNTNVLILYSFTPRKNAVCLDDDCTIAQIERSLFLKQYTIKSMWSGIGDYVQLLEARITSLQIECDRKKGIISKLQGGGSPPPKSNIDDIPTTPLKGDESIPKSDNTKSDPTSTDLIPTKQSRTRKRRRAPRGGVPDEILHNQALNDMLALALPHNYNFEVHKTLWRIQKAKAKSVALQLPEGLLMFACILSDIFERFAGVETCIQSDVTYGACCIDDLGAQALGCDFMVHYGHSCLVPIDVTRASGVEVMYVFVDIKFDVTHLIESIQLTFKEPVVKLVLMGTIQFAQALNEVKKALEKDARFVIDVPQARPLSRGEVLGCTAPKLSLPDQDALVFIADGRFHMESAMIANPDLASFRYDPYSKVLSREGYDHEEMQGIRYIEVDKARKAKKWGIILGTLGRQGNPAILKRLEKAMQHHNKQYIVVMLSEMFPAKLDLFKDVDAWVQIACPRLSIDWGYAFEKPLLNSYEGFVALGEAQWEKIYPQDYYRKDGGKWSNYYED